MKLKRKLLRGVRAYTRKTYNLAQRCQFKNAPFLQNWVAFRIKIFLRYLRWLQPDVLHDCWQWLIKVPSLAGISKHCSSKATALQPLLTVRGINWFEAKKRKHCILMWTVKKHYQVWNLRLKKCCNITYQATALHFGTTNAQIYTDLMRAKLVIFLEPSLTQFTNLYKFWLVLEYQSILSSFQACSSIFFLSLFQEYIWRWLLCRCQLCFENLSHGLPSAIDCYLNEVGRFKFLSTLRAMPIDGSARSLSSRKVEGEKQK